MWPTERHTIPVKAVKSMHAAIADVNAHQAYNVEVYTYRKGFDVRIYHINYYNKQNDLIKAHYLLCSFPAVYESVDYQWVNDSTLTVWFPELQSVDEMKFRLWGDEVNAQVEREY